MSKTLFHIKITLENGDCHFWHEKWAEDFDVGPNDGQDKNLYATAYHHYCDADTRAMELQEEFAEGTWEGFWGQKVAKIEVVWFHANEHHLIYEKQESEE